jgi:hypothetical protein
MQAAPQSAGLLAREVAILFVILSAIAAGVFVARRNLRLGRGDRRGAFRVAGFGLATSLLAWLFGIHHVPDLQGEFDLFFSALARSLFTAVFLWLIYIAIEPIVRRRWPDLLFSWSRLLAGRFRDPLVGRDAMAGILVGSSIALVFALTNALPNWVNLRGMTPAPPSGSFLLGPWATAGHFFALLQDAIQRGLGTMTILVLAQVLLRRKWLAIALVGLLLVALSLSGENYSVELPAGIVIAGLTIFVAVRYGILALAFAFLANLLLIEAPVSLDLSRWHAGRSLLLVAFLTALAVYAFRLSLGGKPAFGSSPLDA